MTGIAKRSRADAGGVLRTAARQRSAGVRAALHAHRLEIGQAAADYLVARLRGAPVEFCRELPFEIVLRVTTGPASRKTFHPAPRSAVIGRLK